MSDLTTRLRALGIEPGENVCDYELRAQESNLIPRLVSDAALDELLTALEEAHKEVKAYQTGFDGDVEAQTARAERAEAERDAAIAQAQGWSCEAKVQRATVNESYQAVTGSTGEPGDWHGAEPIRQRIAELEAERDAALLVVRCQSERIAEAESSADYAHHFADDVAAKLEYQARRAEKVEAELNGALTSASKALAELDRYWSELTRCRQLMREAELRHERTDTAFGILSEQFPAEAKEAWRKAGELGG